VVSVTGGLSDENESTQDDDLLTCSMHPLNSSSIRSRLAVSGKPEISFLVIMNELRPCDAVDLGGSFVSWIRVDGSMVKNWQPVSKRKAFKTMRAVWLVDIVIVWA
jgi:hypothetical protein